MTEVGTDRLLLRGWREGDLEPYARLCADPAVMRYIGDGSTLDRAQSEEQVSRFVEHWERRGFGLWAVEEKAGGAFAGFVGLVHQEAWTEGLHKTEVGWRLGRGFWGRGLATEAARASVAHGFDALDLARILSIIRPGNAASCRLAERPGSPRAARPCGGAPPRSGTR